MSVINTRPLANTSVFITRPVGQGRRLAGKLQKLGAQPVSLPGVSLHAWHDADTARQQLVQALRADITIFTSPNAVRFANKLQPLAGLVGAATVGSGSARALARCGVSAVIMPETQQTSEGLLQHAAMQQLQHKQVGIVCAPGGRGILHRTVVARGAHLTVAHVYLRKPARLQAYHVRAIENMAQTGYILLSSSETLVNIKGGLNPSCWHRLCRAQVIASSRRILDHALELGFAKGFVARSAIEDDLLQKTLDVRRQQQQNTDQTIL